jgi:hypothetical protein
MPRKSAFTKTGHRYPPENWEPDVPTMKRSKENIKFFSVKEFDHTCWDDLGGSVVAINNGARNGKRH